MATVRMVWAEDDRGAIGKDGTLPWHIPSDLAHFKEQTLNSTMVMGRSTWESIGRPLPKRHSVVLTRQTDFDPGFAEVTVVHSLEDLEALMQDELAAGRLVTVAGGAQLYKQLMPMATELSVTKVQGDFDGDTFMEPVNDQDFDLVDQRTASDGDYQLEFLTYKRQ
ncbi:dihydrofolate reductase [Fructobacillus pseudoficulneus]|uniref:Dihydrofolate reductase n=1 Tax=Fructobacillus pseudoficulneus TaxID=220714 RepID=A0A3F3GQW7_9LACO|nr:dihydrofolate reductase [Fructobacillus pseudoficulneus]GAP02164.1 dihydrofolate reductase [Fructobacillus pseudoficulneus]SEH35948.1 dihydrofolate reductase [Fructobacillus pseudoficulneus]